MPLVKIPVRGSAGSRASLRIRMPVSSLYITSPSAACRMNSSYTGRRPSAAFSATPHCVAVGSGMPRFPSSRSNLLNGTPLP